MRVAVVGWAVLVSSVLLTTAEAAAEPAKVPLGQAVPAPAGSVVAGALSSQTPLHIDVVMAPQNPGGLTSFIKDLYDPASPDYHHFLARGQFGPEFGAAPATIQAVTSTLGGMGLHVDSVSTNDLVVSVTATAAQAEEAFGVHIREYHLPAGISRFANTSAPLVPSAIRSDLIGVTGLSNVAPAVPLAVHSSPRSSSPTPSSTASSTPSTSPSFLSPRLSGPTPCEQAVDNNFGAYTANQLADAYGFNTAYGPGRLGTGETVAVYELEKFSMSDISAYESCYGISTSVNVTTVDSGPTGSAYGSGEAALDIEDIAGLAPDVTIDVYEAPQTTSGALDDWSAIANADTAQVASTGWGACEPLQGLSFMQSEETVFEQMATQGQSVVAAAGDDGSEDCYDFYDEGQTSSTTGKSLSVDDPASDPYVTAVGGTSLSSPGTPPTESVWNDGPAPAPPDQGQGAGGGGVSKLWQMPSWQEGVGISAFSSRTPCGAPVGTYCREVPDVSASADPFYAYVVYYTPDGGWTAFGGTSAASPLWAALTALADEGCASPAGFLNPTLYSHAGDLNDITSGNNDYTLTNGGTYPSRTGYDMASGLGTPTSMLFSPGVLCPSSTPADGAGTMTVEPAVAIPSSTGNTLTFTYTAATGGVTSGQIDMVVPSAWSVPTTNSSANGYTTSNCGILGVSGSTIEITAITLGAGSSCTITYGSQYFGGSGATAPSSTGPSTFSTTEKSTVGGTFTSLAVSPTVSVTTPSGLPYTPVTPVRICDTRAAGGAVAANQCDGNGTAAGTLRPGGSLELTVPSLPAGATAVVLNVTATDTTAPSFLTVWPTGGSQPTASNVNWAGGETVANLVEVSLGTSNQVSIYNAFGSADVAVDMEGYVAPPTTSGTGLYNPLSPSRICDTRLPGTGVAANQCNGDGIGAGTLGTSGTLQLQVTGEGGVPANGVSAVVLNVTVTNTTSPGYLTLWPNGASQPTASNLNWVRGDTVANRVIVPVGSGGQVSIYNAFGATDVIVDVNGWFTDNSNSSATGATYAALSPTRICDTRAESSNVSANQCNFGGVETGTLGAGGVLKLNVTGQGGVPAGIQAVVANVTVTDTSASSFLTAWPNGGTQPNTSDVNWVGGETVPNLTVVEIGTHGAVDLYNSSGSADVIVDVEGYYLTG